MSVQLDRIVPWGRTRDEYSRMFALTSADYARGILDCGGGPASFAAESAVAGYRVIAVDPVYSVPPEVIRSRFEAVAGPMLSQVRSTPDDWVWSYHRDPEDLFCRRREALERFLDDYPTGLDEMRYQFGELPTLPFGNDTFGLAVCSHLLFLYSDLLDEAFHVESVLELCRVAGEVRLFPILTLNRHTSPHLDAVRTTVAARGWASEILPVEYELMRGAHQMLRVFQPAPPARRVGS